ncbi:MAG TPA: hypothetical protein VIF62_25620 [Labilithrix sp.]
MATNPGTRIVAIAASLSALSCAATTKETHLELASMRDVSLVSTATLAPDATEAQLADTDFAPEPRAFAHYALVAKRGEDGRIWFEWKLGAPLLNGERQMVLESATQDLTEAPWATPEILRAPTLRIPGCAALHRESVKGTFVGYRASEDAPCWDRSAVAIPFALETPWSNVRVLRQREVPATGAAWGLIILSTVTFGTLATVFFALPNVGRALPWTMVGFGGALDLLALPTLLASEHETFVYPRSP